MRIGNRDSDRANHAKISPGKPPLSRGLLDLFTQEELDSNLVQSGMGSVVCGGGGGGGAGGIMNVDGHQFAPFQNEVTAGTVIAMPSWQHHQQPDENVHPVGLVPQFRTTSYKYAPEAHEAHEALPAQQWPLHHQVENDPFRAGGYVHVSPELAGGGISGGGEGGGVHGTNQVLHHSGHALQGIALQYAGGGAGGGGAVGVGGGWQQAQQQHMISQQQQMQTHMQHHLMLQVCVCVCLSVCLSVCL